MLLYLKVCLRGLGGESYIAGKMIAGKINRTKNSDTYLVVLLMFSRP